ncbi:MAG: BMC domain-containing protein, partial [Lachnospiraceae bacterium]|nr:BMC domain-containing protein [Lachnospiraceae bacterium]
GDVAACRASVDAGKRAAEQIGKVTAVHVIPRPIRIIGDIVSCHDVDIY